MFSIAVEPQKAFQRTEEGIQTLSFKIHTSLHHQNILWLFQTT